MSISIQLSLSDFDLINTMLQDNLIGKYIFEPTLQQVTHGKNTLLTFIGKDGKYYYALVDFDSENNRISSPNLQPQPQPRTGTNIHQPVRIADVGTRYFSIGVERKSSVDFVVTDVTPNGRKMIVRYDDGTIETLEWRRHGRWIPVGTTDKDYRNYSIVFGEKKNGI